MHAGDLEPGTLDYFERVRKRRGTDELPWLSRIIPFGVWSGRRVLEIGCGAGYDAFEIIKHGGEYVGIDLAPENVERTRTHLRYYDYAPQIECADAEELPFEDCVFDVVFSNGVLHHVSDIQRAFSQARRVLRPGGEFWVIVYHRNSVFYRIRLCAYDYLLKRGYRTMTIGERLARVEYTESDELPLVKVYSRRDLRRKLTSAGFEVNHMWVRKLSVDDFPLVPGLGFIVRRTPRGVLERLGRLVGWYVIAQAVKPRKDG